jgi:hypothetical protein
LKFDILRGGILEVGQTVQHHFALPTFVQLQILIENISFAATFFSASSCSKGALRCAVAAGQGDQMGRNFAFWEKNIPDLFQKKFNF